MASPPSFSSSSSPVLAGLLALAGLTGCAAAPPPPPPVVAVEVEREDAGATSMESEIGGMNEAAVERAFEAAQPDVMACIDAGAKRIKELGGRFVVSLRIAKNGNARWAYLSESTLGDSSTEKCITSAMMERGWPKPLGGEGLASRAFDIDPTRAPAEWDPKRMRTALTLASARVAKCRRGVEGGFVATAYVHTSGRVLAAGVAPPDAESQEAADCLAEAISGWRLGPTGRRPAKVTFAID